MQNIITEDMEKMLTGDIKYLITNDIIVDGLKRNYEALQSKVSITIILLLFICILTFIVLKKIRIHIRLIPLVIVWGVISVLTISSFEERDALKYTIGNNCWYIDKDIVEKKDTLYRSEADSKSYYVCLIKYGKVSISRNMYTELTEGEDVYVIVIKDKEGNCYANDVYPYDSTVYLEELPQI